MAVEPQGKFFYMGLPGGQIGYLVGLNIDQASGAVSFNQVSYLAEVGAVAVDPSGKFLFLTSTGSSGGNQGGVGTFVIDSQTGAFTSIGGVAIDNSFAYKVSVDPLDRFVYVAYFQEDGPHLVIPLTLDSNSGTLSRVAAPVAVDQGDWLVPDPSGRFLYVGNSGSNTISAFKVDPTSGALTPIAGAPFATTGAATQLDAAPGAIDPSGKYLYVTSSVASNVSVYAIDHNSGRLAPVNGSPFPTGAAPVAVLAEPLGRFVYVSGHSGISAFQVDSANGALTAIGGSPFAPAFAGDMSFSY